MRQCLEGRNLTPEARFYVVLGDLVELSNGGIIEELKVRSVRPHSRKSLLRHWCVALLCLLEYELDERLLVTVLNRFKGLGELCDAVKEFSLLLRG